MPACFYMMTDSTFPTPRFQKLKYLNIYDTNLFKIINITIRNLSDYVVSFLRIYFSFSAYYLIHLLLFYTIWANTCGNLVARLSITIFLRLLGLALFVFISWLDCVQSSAWQRYHHQYFIN